MASLENPAFLAALLLSAAFGVANGIRPLKEKPTPDPEGREYKMAPLEEDLAAEEVKGPPPAAASAVDIRCTGTSMIIQINASLFEEEYHASPSELFLGPEKNHSCRAVAVGVDEYVIEARLHECGSKLTIFGDYMIYSNKVRFFSPVTGRHHVITRITNTVIPVSCYYQSTQLASNNGLEAPMSISRSTQYSEKEPGFFLKLMTDDWKRERSSNIFYLGDLLRLEAVYHDPASVPRQLFIEDCVATLEPDATSVPRYYFIENHGCLTDAKENGSKARFRPRTRADALRLQLDAFMFKRDNRNSIFITCQLKATAEMWMSGPTNKACDYEHARWRDVDGNDGVCGCCDTDCHDGSPPWDGEAAQQKRIISEDTMICGTVTFGPLMIIPRK